MAMSNINDDITQYPEQDDRDARIKALKAEVEGLRDALRDLLEDTQHREHDCIDEDCPVKNARAALGERQ